MSRPAAQEPDAESLARCREFLLANPDFFRRCPDVLEALDIPHASGAASSLIERQVAMLRRRCRTLESRLRDLVAVARDNESLSRRLHRLIQHVIAADSIGDVLALTGDCLQRHFQTDSVRVVVLVDAQGRPGDLPTDLAVTIAPDDPRLGRFARCLEDGTPRCGRVDASLRHLVSPEADWPFASAAVVPLAARAPIGLLVLGSRDPARFTEDAGVHFLDQLGDVLSRRLATLPLAI